MDDKIVKAFFSVGIISLAAIMTDLFLYEIEGGRATPLLVFTAACFAVLVVMGLFLIWRKHT